MIRHSSSRDQDSLTHNGAIRWGGEGNYAAATQSQLRLFARLNTDHTKAEEAISLRRRIPVAVCRPTVESRAAPGAAAAHATRASRRTSGVRHATTRVVSMPIIQTPLINITVHIIQPPALGCFPPTGCVVLPEFSRCQA